MMTIQSINQTKMFRHISYLLYCLNLRQSTYSILSSSLYVKWNIQEKQISHIQDAKRRWRKGGKKWEEERPGDKSHGQKENTARPGGSSLKNEEDEGSSPRTDEVTRAKREALHQERVQRGSLSWIDTNGARLCPRLPLVIAKPRRARFSPILPPATPSPLSSFHPRFTRRPPSALSSLRSLPSVHPLWIPLCLHPPGWLALAWLPETLSPCLF